MSLSQYLSLDSATRISSLSAFPAGQQRGATSRIQSTRTVLAAAAAQNESSPPCAGSPARASALRPALIAGIVTAFAASVPPALAETIAAAADGAAAASTALAEACAQQLGGADLNTVVGVVCLLEFIALTGAAVGGNMARQQGAEMERINAQLRQINLSLRRQTRVEPYAPSLTYSPPPASSASPAAAVSTAAAADAPAAATAVAVAEPAVAAVGVGSAAKAELLHMLKEGKKHLRDGHPGSAYVEFHLALSKAREMQDSVEEKKAARGLGASCQRQKKYKEAIAYHQLVLEKSAATGEHSGDTEAYGAIADCYTELRDMEKAAIYYDRYINRLEQDSDEE